MHQTKSLVSSTCSTKEVVFGLEHLDYTVNMSIFVLFCEQLFDGLTPEGRLATGKVSEPVFGLERGDYVYIELEYDLVISIEYVSKGMVENKWTNMAEMILNSPFKKAFRKRIDSFNINREPDGRKLVTFTFSVDVEYLSESELFDLKMVRAWQHLAKTDKEVSDALEIIKQGGPNSDNDTWTCINAEQKVRDDLSRSERSCETGVDHSSDRLFNEEQNASGPFLKKLAERDRISCRALFEQKAAKFHLPAETPKTCPCFRCQEEKPYDPETHTHDQKYEWDQFLLFVGATLYPKQDAEAVSKHMRELFDVSKNYIKTGQFIRFSEKDLNTALKDEQTNSAIEDETVHTLQNQLFEKGVAVQTPRQIEKGDVVKINNDVYSRARYEVLKIDRLNVVKLKYIGPSATIIGEPLSNVTRVDETVQEARARYRD
jgi:hypothetical protein